MYQSFGHDTRPALTTIRKPQPLPQVSLSDLRFPFFPEKFPLILTRKFINKIWCGVALSELSCLVMGVLYFGVPRPTHVPRGPFLPGSYVECDQEGCSTDLVFKTITVSWGTAAADAGVKRRYALYQFRLLSILPFFRFTLRHPYDAGTFYVFVEPFNPSSLVCPSYPLGSTSRLKQIGKIRLG